VFEVFGVVNASSHKFRTCPSCHAPHRRQSPGEVRSHVLGSAELRASLHRSLEAFLNSPQSPLCFAPDVRNSLEDPEPWVRVVWRNGKVPVFEGWRTANDPYDPHRDVLRRRRARKRRPSVPEWSLCQESGCHRTADQRHARCLGKWRNRLNAKFEILLSALLFLRV